MIYVDRYAEMMHFKNRPSFQVDGQLFERKDRWIVPVGPVAQPYHLDKAQCCELLRQLGGLWVMWTDGVRSSESGSDWYAVICRQHIPVDNLKSREARRKTRRGLNGCEVKMVSCQEIANKGYDTYCAAMRGYGNVGSFPSQQEFTQRVMTDEAFADIRHHWAVYSDNKMIAFAQNLVYELNEVDYTLMKFNPEYLDRFPSYALLHTMNEYYLAQKHFNYVNDGFRSISHDTNVQQFLIKNFGFEKAYTNLHVHYRPPIGKVLRLARPLRSALTRLYPKAAALFELDRLRCR